MALSRDDVIAKIKRLLRLSRSQNVEEAATAARHAQRMMSKYQLELAELGDVDDDGGEAPKVSVQMGEDGLYTAKSLPFWICRLAACLADLNHCEAFIRSAQGEQSIGIVGAPRNVSYIRYVFAYLRREIMRLCREKAKLLQDFRRRRVGTKWRTDFRLGATDEVILRMQEAKDDAFCNASPQALMRVNVIRKAAKSWVEENVTKPGRKRRKRDHDRGGYYAGRYAAQEIQIESPELALGDGKDVEP